MSAISTTLEELKKKRITLADYLLMPELNYPYEIIDGEMVPSPAPTPAHQIISRFPLIRLIVQRKLAIVFP